MQSLLGIYKLNSAQSWEIFEGSLGNSSPTSSPRWPTVGVDAFTHSMLIELLHLLPARVWYCQTVWNKQIFQYLGHKR